MQSRNLLPRGQIINKDQRNNAIGAYRCNIQCGVTVPKCHISRGSHRGTVVRWIHEMICCTKLKVLFTTALLDPLPIGFVTKRGYLMTELCVCVSVCERVQNFKRHVLHKIYSGKLSIQAYICAGHSEARPQIPELLAAQKREDSSRSLCSGPSYLAVFTCSCQARINPNCSQDSSTGFNQVCQVLTLL